MVLEKKIPSSISKQIREYNYHFDKIRYSKSWALTSPLRIFNAKKYAFQPEPHETDPECARHRYETVLNSASWLISSPLRSYDFVKLWISRYISYLLLRVRVGWKLRLRTYFAKAWLSLFLDIRRPWVHINKLIRSTPRRPVIVSFSHTDYKTDVGGIERYLRDEAAQCYKQKINHIHIFPVTDRRIKILRSKHPLFGIHVNFHFAQHISLPELQKLLRKYKEQNFDFKAVNIHHLLFTDTDTVGAILNALDMKCRFFIHDYYSVCSQFTLMKNNDEYCGVDGIDSDICNDCQFNHGRKNHVSSMLNFFKNHCAEFVTPSECSKNIWLSHFGEFQDRIHVQPLQTPIEIKQAPEKEAPEKKVIRIAYVGYAVAYKGWRTWQKLADYFGTNLNYQLYHFGNPFEERREVISVPVSFQRDGAASMTDALKTYDIDIAVLWSARPEPYCYTFYESLAAGCYVLSHASSGNIANQIKHYDVGTTFKNEQELFDFLDDESTVQEAVRMHRANRKLYNLESTPSLGITVANTI